MKNNIETKIYGYSDFFKLFLNLDLNNNVPNKFIISGRKGIGKLTFAHHLINYLLSKNEDSKYDKNNYEINIKNRSFKLVRNNTHPNFYSIDTDEGKKNIGIDQIRKSFDFINRSSFNNKCRIILINNNEYLNNNSSNALLKILEEPNEKLIFILIHNSSFKILDTIKSRCLLFKKNFSEKESISIFDKLSNYNFNNFFDDNLLSKFFSVGELFLLKEFSDEIKFQEKISAESILRYYFSNLKVKYDKKNTNLLLKLIQMYFYKKNLENFDEYDFSAYNSFFKKVSDAKKFNLDIENLYFEFQSKCLNE